MHSYPLHLFRGMNRFPLPLITVKMMNVFKTLYEIPGMCVSVEQAVELDAAQNIVRSSFSPDVYRQPVLTESIVEPQIRWNSSENTGGLRQGRRPMEIDDAKIADSGKII